MPRPNSTTPTRDTANPHGPIAHPDPTRHPNPEPAILTPSTELLGCLLQASPTDAAPILDLVHDDDLPDALEQHALMLIRDLVARGVTPTCATVLAHARTTGTTRAQFELLAKRLIDAKFGAPLPNADYLAGVVLEDAYRRAGIDYATRIQQAAHDASLDDYERVLGDRDRLRDLWRRHRTALGENPVREVGAA